LNFEADFKIMASEVKKLLEELLQALGGDTPSP